MKFLPLIWADIMRKPLRTVLTVLALTAAFTLFGLLRSVDYGFDHLIAAGQMDRLYTNSRFFNLPMPMAYVDQIAHLDGVKAVGYQAFVSGYSQDPKTFFFVGGASSNILDLDSEIVVSKADLEALHAKRNGVLISPWIAKHLGGVKVGDHIPLHSNDVTLHDGSREWDFELVGFVDRQDSPGVFSFSIGNFDFINESRAEPKNVVQNITIRVNDPDKAIAIARRIDALFINSGTPTHTVVDRVTWESGVASMGNIKFMVNGISTIVFFVLLLLIGTTFAQSVEERTSELGVMKTLGFTDRAVLNMVLSESLIQSLFGACVGLGIATVVSPMMQGRLPGPPVFFRLPVSVFAIGLLAAAAIALVAAAIPALRASRLHVVEALARR